MMQMEKENVRREMTTYETNDEKFAAFLAEIDRLATKYEWASFPSGYVKATGEDCWREAYDDGMSADEAWSEEVDAAASMA